MRVWNGKIRAENVLVEGGIESASVVKRGTLPQSVQSLLSLKTLRRLWPRNFGSHVGLMVPNVSSQPRLRPILVNFELRIG
jgi:hypothetical protein